MAQHFGMYIPGAKPGNTPLEITAPFDGSLIATADTADSVAVEQALATAYALYQDRGKWLSPAERITILQKAITLMEAQVDELALESAREGGKPLIDSKVEAVRAIDSLRSCIDCVRTESGREIPMGINAASQNHMAVTSREPIGVVVAVSAFNHPINLIVHQVGPAIASGCPVIVKPAEDTPLSCFRLVDILRQAGLPDEWCQALVVKDLEVASQLVTDQRVGFFSFIGSARVGWMLRSKLAPGVRCALEHGGAAPVIVEADADLDDALPLLAKGGFYHAGQVCVSVQRVFAHESIARDVANRLSELGQKMKIGDPTLADTEIGPLIRTREMERVHEWVTDGIAAGAEKICGGEKISDTCYTATVLYDPPDDATISQNEIFGPVICVYPFNDTDDAIRRANALPYSFQASVFTSQIDKAMHAYKHLDASAVMINNHTAFRVDWMPFAGLRQSGLGVGGIPYTFHDMQIDKMMVIRSSKL